jgi:hypothetical protein
MINRAFLQAPWLITMDGLDLQGGANTTQSACFFYLLLWVQNMCACLQFNVNNLGD